MRIFLAGPYRDRKKIRKFRDRLKRAGISVIARWLTSPVKDFRRLSQKAKEKGIKIDIDDLMKADTFVIYSGQSPGGKETEFGMALNLKLPTLMIGKRRQLYHFHPLVTKVDTQDEAFTMLVRWDQDRKNGNKR